MQKIKISLTRFETMMHELADQIKTVGQRKYNDIYPIPRGGFAVALWLSHSLNIPIVEKNDATKDTLIVDDISETGKTLKDWAKKGNDTACLFTSDWTKVEPTFWLENKLERDSWIIFPWENSKTERGYSK